VGGIKAATNHVNNHVPVGFQYVQVLENNDKLYEA